jgi:hypothetical protein
MVNNYSCGFSSASVKHVYILKDATILDIDINQKLEELFKLSDYHYLGGQNYKLTVGFHVDLLNDSRLNSFKLPETSLKFIKKEKDKLYQVLSVQLNNIREVFNNNGVNVKHSSIEGDKFDNVNNTIVTVVEDDVKEYKFRVNCILPSIPAFRQRTYDMINNGYHKHFNKFMDIVHNKKTMARILNIKSTNDDDLFLAFVDQYSGIWISSEKQTEKFMERYIQIVKEK